MAGSLFQTAITYRQLRSSTGGICLKDSPRTVPRLVISGLQRESTFGQRKHFLHWIASKPVDHER